MKDERLNGYLRLWLLNQNARRDGCPTCKALSSSSSIHNNSSTASQTTLHPSSTPSCFNRHSCNWVKNSLIAFQRRMKVMSKAVAQCTACVYLPRSKHWNSWILQKVALLPTCLAECSTGFVWVSLSASAVLQGSSVLTAIYISPHAVFITQTHHPSLFLYSRNVFATVTQRK